jgi:hypothetical protein
MLGTGAGTTPRPADGHVGPAVRNMARSVIPMDYIQRFVILSLFA